MNKKSLLLSFAAAFCGANLSFAHDVETTEVVVISQEANQETDVYCSEIVPTEEAPTNTDKKVETTLAEQDLPELTADEEQELEKLIAELIKAQQEQEAALAAQEQE